MMLPAMVTRPEPEPELMMLTAFVDPPTRLIVPVLLALKIMLPVFAVAPVIKMLPGPSLLNVTVPVPLGVA
ncbi:MAG: hypothetical protein QM775_16845 [Pirellulales bacterium]